MTLSAAERSGLTWVKAQYSTAHGQCVEVASTSTGGTVMRDSKDPAGPILIYPTEEFRAFLEGARNGEFDNLGH